MRKCGRIVIVGRHTLVLLARTLVGMIVTKGQSQGRRNLAEDEDDELCHDYFQGEKGTFSFSQKEPNARAESSVLLLSEKIRVLYII